MDENNLRRLKHGEAESGTWETRTKSGASDLKACDLGTRDSGPQESKSYEPEVSKSKSGQPGDWKPLLLFLFLTLGIGSLSGFLTSASMQEYSVMKRPPLAPPGWIFPVVWTILYILMAVAAWLVYEADVPESVPALKLYVAQLLVNGAWPILFFNLHAYYAAFFWIVLLFILAALTAKKFSQINPLAGKLFVPYLLWLVFAGYLNAAIAVLN